MTQSAVYTTRQVFHDYRKSSITHSKIIRLWQLVLPEIFCDCSLSCWFGFPPFPPACFVCLSSLGGSYVSQNAFHWTTVLSMWSSFRFWSNSGDTSFWGCSWRLIVSHWCPTFKRLFQMRPTNTSFHRRLHVDPNSHDSLRFCDKLFFKEAMATKGEEKTPENFSGCSSVARRWLSGRDKKTTDSFQFRTIFQILSDTDWEFNEDFLV